VAFGQDDDITVLTLTRLATGEKSTTSLLAPGLVKLDVLKKSTALLVLAVVRVWPRG
jgi:hypothetical protein